MPATFCAILNIPNRNAMCADYLFSYDDMDDAFDNMQIQRFIVDIGLHSDKNHKLALQDTFYFSF